MNFWGQYVTETGEKTETKGSRWMSKHFPSFTLAKPKQTPKKVAEVIKINSSPINSSQPQFISSSVTETKLLSDQALLALDHTTPVETTQTVLLKHHCLLPVATLAAQQITAADVHGCAVAHAAPCPQWTCFPICKAEIGRLVRVDQILLIWWFYVLTNRDQGLAVVAAHHLGSAIEALQQAVAHLTEMRHLFPACAQGAWARQSMAFAFCPHVELHCLGRESAERSTGAGKRREVNEGKQVEKKSKRNREDWSDRKKGTRNLLTLYPEVIQKRFRQMTSSLKTLFIIVFS